MTEHLSRDIQQIGPLQALHVPTKPIALVVDADEGSRNLAAALLEETDLAVVECASAEVALTVLERRRETIRFVFVDQHLEGARDGAELARMIVTLWPGLTVVLTGAASPDQGSLPAAIVPMRKPWRGLDLLLAAERALSRAELARAHLGP